MSSAALPPTHRGGPGRPQRISTLADRCRAEFAKELEKVRDEEAQAEKIIATPVIAVAYLARALWDKYASGALLALSKKGGKVLLEFKPFLALQVALRGDSVLHTFMRREIAGCSPKEVGEKIVAIAVLEGFSACTFRRWRHSEGEASPYQETFVSISLPEHAKAPKAAEEDAEGGENEAAQA